MNRTAQAKWDKNNLKTISTKLPTQEAHELEQMAGHAGYQSTYALLQDLIVKWQITQHKENRRHKTEGNFTLFKGNEG